MVAALLKWGGNSGIIDEKLEYECQYERASDIDHKGAIRHGAASEVMNLPSYKKTTDGPAKAANPYTDNADHVKFLLYRDW